MHPEVEQNGPGSCPKCGMALEPQVQMTLDTESSPPDPELVDMQKRFWVGLIFTIPLFLLAMSEMLPNKILKESLSGSWSPWAQLILATPVVLWSGGIFFQRGWQSIINHSLNMFTLIAMGTGTAYLYSLIATVFPQIFPSALTNAHQQVPVYFEAAAMITLLVPVTSQKRE